jgi:alcohol dehydrogenase (cytochrome c)
MKILVVIAIVSGTGLILAAQQPRTNSSGSTAAGEALFFGKAGCASCHEVNGRGGVTGPDLSGAGTRSPEALREEILNPVSSAAPATGRGGGPPPTVSVKLEDGREIRGIRPNEDTFSIQIVDASGQLHLLDKMKLSSVHYESSALMPSDYASRLTPEELQTLIAYLGSLKGRDTNKAAAAEIPGGVAYERLRGSDAEPQNWLHYWGNYQGTHYSPLKQITRDNIWQLQGQWSFEFQGPVRLETEPLVVDGVMYATAPPGTVVAIDAKTGQQIWRFTREQKVKNPNEINPYNRGVAILGNRLFMGTLDAALVAIDARTGRLLWETQVADSMLGYSITSAPLAIKDKVIVGITGGEFGARGFLDAYDAATGKKLWRWYAIPGPGEFGNDTWAGDSWKTGGVPCG